MENKDPERIPRPGVSESLHPEIGNGALWDQTSHDFLLRSPDPSKSLEARLTDPGHEKKVIRIWKKAQVNEKLAGSLPTEPADDKSDQPAARKELLANQGPGIKEDETKPFISRTSRKEKESLPTRRKKKAKSIKPEIRIQDVVSEPQMEETLKGKAPKAGKRVRKVVKTVQRKEKAEKRKIKKEESPVKTDPGLSPFTQWLKNLRGSDYVHPYEDDFAFIQGTGPAKDGISETYAELLAAQGYKERAVEMYMKLIEKNPEKSGYFAAKIEALQ